MGAGLGPAPVEGHWAGSKGQSSAASNLEGMKLRRAAALIAALSIMVVTAMPAGAATNNPYFKTGSEGAPASTLVGRWDTSADGRTVGLQLVGGHVVGGKTWFEAGWVSPWTAIGKRASFESNAEFSSLNTVGESIRFEAKLRWRDKGGAWAPWQRFPMDLEIEGGSWGGMGFGSGFGSGSRGSMRFEWRVRGVLTATAELDGTISLSVN